MDHNSTESYANDERTNLEIQLETCKLHRLVDVFATRMRARLAQKAREGYTGWDDRLKVESRKLIWDMADDINYITVYFQGERTEHKIENKKLIDIANRAMFLWARENLGVDDPNKPETGDSK